VKNPLSSSLEDKSINIKIKEISSQIQPLKSFLSSNFFGDSLFSLKFQGMKYKKKKKFEAKIK
jgi:hypothetical protein